MQTASTRHPRTPDTSIGQEPTPTQRRLRLPAEDAIRAFDDFVEDCTTLACLSVLNAQGAQRQRRAGPESFDGWGGTHSRGRARRGRG
jgi:hypothetical protein